MKFSITATEKDFDKILELSKEYDANLEYIEFYDPNVYTNPDEVERLISFYTSQGRDTSNDTMHGVFYGVEVTAYDPILRERSRELYHYSMKTAERLGVRGVVFHSGLISSLNLESYVNGWVSQSESFFRELAAAYPNTEIYVENTFEEEPIPLIRLAKAMSDVPNFGLCFDYAHAVLTRTTIEKWCMEMAPYVKHMHINDNDFKRDLHLVPGDGCINYAEWKYLMDKYGIDTSVLIELGKVEDARKGLEYLTGDLEPSGCKPKPHNVLNSVLGVSVALSAEKDPKKLLSLIVNTAMNLTDSDGGTLYLIHENELHFMVMKTKSKGIDLGENGEVIDLPPVPLNEKHICGYTAITGKTLNIPDVYNCDEFDFSGPKHYDKINNYHTQSMVVIPLTDNSGDILGVLQLLNAQANGIVRAFTSEEEMIIQALGSQAAIALTNMNYVSELNEQMWSFTEAMTEAIDARTPYNASHTRKVAEYSGMIADYINMLHDKGVTDEYFTKERRDQLTMAALLHDIGKLVVPMEVMNKMTRLGNKYGDVMDRLKTIMYKSEIAYLKGTITEDYYLSTKAYVEECIKILPSANIAGHIEDSVTERLEFLFNVEYCANGECIRFFKEEEKEALRVKSGTLTENERKQMENHVVLTDRILGKVHFNRFFKDTRKWASEHHERIDGSGYPNGLVGDELCIESRIIAVADICDALIASDRPYRSPLPKKIAFDILRGMADKGELDGYLIDYLEKSLEGRAN